MTSQIKSQIKFLSAYTWRRLCVKSACVFVPCVSSYRWVNFSRVVLLSPTCHFSSSSSSSSSPPPPSSSFYHSFLLVWEIMYFCLGFRKGSCVPCVKCPWHHQKIFSPIMTTVLCKMAGQCVCVCLSVCVCVWGVGGRVFEDAHFCLLISVETAQTHMQWC